MEGNAPFEHTARQIVDAMQLSSDPITAAGASSVSSLALEDLAQAMHLARCIAAFTTDDALADEMSDIVDESPPFMIGQVVAVRHGLKSFGGKQAELEKRIWTLIYAGRRERSRVMQTLARRQVL